MAEKTDGSAFLVGFDDIFTPLLLRASDRDCDPDPEVQSKRPKGLKTYFVYIFRFLFIPMLMHLIHLRGQGMSNSVTKCDRTVVCRYEQKIPSFRFDSNSALDVSLIRTIVLYLTTYISPESGVRDLAYNTVYGELDLRLVRC